MHGLQDDEELFDYNVDERVEAFVKACNDQVSCPYIIIDIVKPV